MLSATNKIIMIKTNEPNNIDFKNKFDLNNKVIVITGVCGLVGRAFSEASSMWRQYVG